MEAAMMQPGREGMALDEMDGVKRVCATLLAEANRRVSRRHVIEERWIRNLEQYHGYYDPDTAKRLEEAERSQLFINLTGPKTDAMAARLEDMLFPTDDRNWGIKPTPVPELSMQAQEAVRQAMQAREQAEQAAMAADQDPNNPQAAAAADQAEALMQEAERIAAEFQAEQAEARRRAESMELEIEDQLKEGRYQAECRDAIANACKIGMGVMKGPCLDSRSAMGWTEVQQPDGSTIYQLKPRGSARATIRNVDPWSYFPDPDARDIRDGSGDFERHLSNERALRRLARDETFDKEAIRRLLRSKPTAGSAPDYLTMLRNISAEQEQVSGPLWHVWEYTGPLAGEDLESVLTSLRSRGAEVDDPEVYGLVRDESGEIDPLLEINVVIWFCDNEILKIAPHPLDSGETLYSVFTIKRDEATVFGFGIPQIMAHPQSMLNGAGRMLMDNMGLAAGPQIVVDKEQIEPEDGDWTARPMKTWQRKGYAPQGQRPFEIFNIDSHAQELVAVIQLAEKQIDDVTGMPMIAQGEQGTGVTKTAQGMAILMNSTNVVFRRVVKIFDDDMTTPNIRRMYDWNMQHAEKAHIKGDYEIDARGSSVLLVREMQAQNFMMIAMGMAAHPLYQGMFKHYNLAQSLLRAHMITPDEVMISEEEMKAATRNQPEDPMAALKARELDIREAEIDGDIEKANMEADGRIRVAMINRETQMMMLAERLNMTADELATRLQMKRLELGSKERGMAVEAAMAQRTGQHAGGAV